MLKVTYLADPQRKAETPRRPGAVLPNAKYTQNQSICNKQVLMNP
jgi:hypothetical protein